MNDYEGSVFHLVGGGISSLSAAVFLIRDLDVAGQNIRVYEQSTEIGGSLDGASIEGLGLVTRGGRMFEPSFVCTFNLLSSIPSHKLEGGSVKDEIISFNQEVVGSSNCRLVEGGEKADMTSFGLGWRDLCDFGLLIGRSEASLEKRRIDECFRSSFFRTNFWIMWSTMFAFQLWHSAVELRRYFRRFIHLMPGFARIEGVLRTPLNQFESVVQPIQSWLEDQGVCFTQQARVLDLELVRRDQATFVTGLRVSTDDREDYLTVNEGDHVFVTLGSMTECSSLGSTESPAAPISLDHSGSWTLWRRLVQSGLEVGNPETFIGHEDLTGWESFSVTLDRPDFFEYMETFTGNVAGTGGLVTIKDSNWMMSIVLFKQPHFKDQGEDRFFFWGYGLFPERCGDFIQKPMRECSGREILLELAGHLRLGQDLIDSLAGAVCIPCFMPAITSQFMPREQGDRPLVNPPDAANVSFMGQYCELNDDVVFTVEYSVRSAMEAVYGLEGSNKAPPVRKTYKNPLVIVRAMLTMLKGMR